MRFTITNYLALGATAFLAAGLPAAVPAADLGYTYAEARYLDVDARPGGSADGGTVIGWYRLGEHFFALGQAVRTEADSGAEATTGAFGGGFIMPLGQKWDAVAIGTFRHTEIDLATGDVKEDGYGAQLGLRGMPIPKLETRLFANYVDVVDDDTSAFVSADYWITPSFAAGVAADFGGNADTYSIGVRYSFGN
jgi:hypothetical protein